MVMVASKPHCSMFVCGNGSNCRWMVDDGQETRRCSGSAPTAQLQQYTAANG